MAGPTNQLDWGQLLGMYSQAADAAQPALAQKQAQERDRQRAAINSLMGGIESNVYANIGRGVAGDVTQAPGYSQLIDNFNAHEKAKAASQLQGAAWETLFKNPSQSTTPMADPYDSVQSSLQKMQANANQQAQWNLGQNQFRQDQENRRMDDNLTGGNFRKAWDAWMAGGGRVPNMDNGRLTSNMQRSQEQWQQEHGGKLEGWFNSLPGAYYSRAMGGYSPQAYTYNTGNYAGGFGGPAQTDPNATNNSTDKPDDEASY